MDRKTRCLLVFKLSVGLIIALGTMIDLVDISEDTFKRFSPLRPAEFSIIGKIHAFDNDLSSGRQCITCLDALIRRLYQLGKMEWLEQALVTRVYVNGKYPPTQGSDGAKDLRKLLDGRLNLSAAHHSRVEKKYSQSTLKQSYLFGTNGELNVSSIDFKLLWKISDGFFAKRQFEDALAWSSLAHHDLLNQHSSNDAKFQRSILSTYIDCRRMIRCLIELERPGEARDIIDQILESSPHALTYVLQFQIAVRCDAEELGITFAYCA